MRALAVLLLAAAALLSGCKKKAPPNTVGLALDVGGRGDQSFNDGTLRGLENMAAGLRYTPRGYEPLPDRDYRELLPPDLRSKPFPHLRIPQPIVLQGKAQEDYEPNLRLLAAQGADLVVAVGFMMEPATRKVARDNPGTKFLLIDSPVLDDAGKPATLPNVRAVVFRENEGTFLAGAAAGELTRTGKVGFVGGMQLPLIQKFETGFRAGVSTVNPEAGRNLLVAYTGTFDDERKGVEVGLDLYRRGCDVVFHAAGLDGLGVIKAAQLSGKLVIGVDSDQSHVAPENVITSMVKHADVVVYDTVRDVVQGKFAGGDVVLGLADDAMGLMPLSPAVSPTLRAMGFQTPQELVAIVFDVQTLQHAVMTRRIRVPATLEELKAFRPPDPAQIGMLRAAKP
jgi:basic membrane protein A and related proteins